jgi:putative DNA primase/helicase
VPAARWPRLFKAFNGIFEGGIDPQTKPVCQAFYLPSCPEDNKAHAFIWNIEGDIFDAISMLDEIGDDVDATDEEVRPITPTGSSTKECPRKLAEEVLRSMFHGQLKYFNYEFNAYGQGYWKPQSRKVDIEKRIMESYKALSIGVVKQIVENLEALTIVTDISPTRVDGGRLLCLNNGTLDLTTGELLDHDPGHNLVNKMDVDWSPTATAPIFYQALSDIFRDDDDRDVRIEFVQEWFGYCLIPDISQHKFLWLVGSGGNGKSVILNTLAALIGKENVSYAMLERMGKPSVRAELQGKLCNISHEMSSDATIADGYLKAIVAGDWVEAERKFQPSFSYQPFVRIVAATNSLPYLKDTTDGFFRRAIILELTRKFTGKEVDKHLQEKILAELDGILVFAVQGLQRLLKRDEFVILESAIRMANKYRDESDSVRYFVKEACTPYAKGTKPAALYEQYQRFAARFRFPALNLIKFGKQLTALGIESRDSNGSKFWQLAAKEFQSELYSSESLADAMSDA